MNLDESSHQFKPTKNLLKKAKTATWNYNQLHDGKSKKDNNTQQTTSFSASASTSIPTNSSAPTKSYSKNAADLKATCGNIASTAASTRGPVNSSNRTSNETIPIPRPSGVPAFIGHTLVRQDKKKPNVGKRKIDAAIRADQTDHTKKKKGGEPLVSKPANGVKGKTNNDSNKAKPGPTSHSTSSPSFSKKNEDRKDCNDKNNAPSFSKKDDKRKTSKCKNFITQMSLFSFQKPPTAFKIVEVPKQLAQEFLDIAKENSLKNIETCGIIDGKDAGKKFTVTYLSIPKQQGTSDSCIAVDEDLTNNALQQNSCIVLGWIHTHPTQKSFLSSVDFHTHFGYQSLLPEAFAVVYSIKYASTTFLHLTKYGMKIIQSCKLSGFHQHDDSTLKHLFEESDNYQSVDIPLTVRDLGN